MILYHARLLIVLLLGLLVMISLGSVGVVQGFVVNAPLVLSPIRPRFSAASPPQLLPRITPHHSSPINNNNLLRRPIRSPPTTRTMLLSWPKGIELAGLMYDDTSTAFDAWEWNANLGAPAALVAGAVLVTLSETRERMTPRKSDKNWVRVLKQTTRLLLLSSFAMEVVSIFVSTVTGTVLLSHDACKAKDAVGYGSPLGLLHHHHEFEYLTIQIFFLQGLLNWLASVALEFLLPTDNETLSARRMNKFMASSLATLIFWMLAFYNHHLTFYSDYLQMLKRYVILFVVRYFGTFRPLALLYGPASIISAIFGWKAFNTKPDLDED